MDLTPPPKMFEAMSKFVDAMCGEDPHPRMIGPGAEKVRVNRRAMFDFLHHLVAISMREGAARAGNGHQTPMEQAVGRATQAIQGAKMNGHDG